MLAFTGVLLLQSANVISRFFRSRSALRMRRWVRGAL
jgi:hypothetical protein